MWGQRGYQFYPLGMVTLFIEEEEGAEEEVEEEENGWVRDHLKENQSKGLGGVLPMKMEEEMGQNSIPRLLWKEIRDRQEQEWSSPVSDGRGRRDVTVSSPPIQESQQMTPPTPTPSEDRFFMDWSSVRMRSPPVRTPPQSILVRERGQEINQTTIQTSQLGSEPTQIAPHEDLPRTTSLAQQQPLDRLSMIDEIRMNDVGTNTLDVVVEQNRDRLRTSTMEANAQTSIPIVDIMLPSCRGDHLMIPQVNLSTSGYELDSLRTSHMRSPSMRAQEISIMPQLDGLGSLPMRDPVRRRMHEVSRSTE